MELQERRRLNDEIEKAYMEAAACYRLFFRYEDTERGIALLDLYERFFDSFSLLVVLTSDLPHLKDFQDAVSPSIKWVELKAAVDTDGKLLARLKSGMTLFKAYKKILTAQGIIALPSR